jgi:hypothetical protein
MMVEVHGRPISGRTERFTEEVCCSNEHSWMVEFAHETDTNATYPVSSKDCVECGEPYVL